MKYNKLVRDKIPSIMKKKSKKFKGEDKEELADIFEVIYALSRAKGISKVQIEKTRSNKAKEKGSFSNKIILDEVN